jgi:penicillin-binding protein 1A
MTTMLERVLTPHRLPHIGPDAYPTGWRLGIGRPAAGKTGTSSNEADAWFIGYEPQLVVGVWEGNPRAESPQLFTLSNRGPAYGAVAAGPIWRQTMVAINRLYRWPKIAFHRPPGLVYLPRVSITSGLLPGPHCPKTAIEGAWFVRGTEPRTPGHSHILVRVTRARPARRWHRGDGRFVQQVYLRPEPDWHPGMPRPWDSRFWSPAARAPS